MEPEKTGETPPYRYLEPPIPLDQMIESVDVGKHPDTTDSGYRDQEWLIRNAIG